MIKLYSLFTPSHRVLKERYFEPTLPQDVELHMRFFDSEGEGSIQDASWRRAIGWKVEVVLQAIEENWGEVFVFSDVDVQFFGSFADWVPRATAQYDLVFQIDAPGPSLCTGFFFCRANNITRAVWQRVRKRVRASEAREDDQASLRKLVWQVPELRWNCLPPVFYGGGTLTDKQWNPGCELPLPEGILMHHANFTCGVNNKMLQCEYVRQRARLGPFVPLAEAYQRVRVRDGFAYEPSLSANDPPPGVNGQNTDNVPPVPDYDRLLTEMANDPESHPYATEPGTAEFLGALVRFLGSTSILELGTYKGFTTVHLIRALAHQPGARLVTIDLCDQRSRQLRALDRCSFIHGHDLEIIPTLPGEFDFVYIDTTHRYEHTAAEIEAVRAHSPSAVLALHDAVSCPGVAQAVHEFAAYYDSIILPTPPHPTLGWVNGLAILWPRTRRESAPAPPVLEAMRR